MTSIILTEYITSKQFYKVMNLTHYINITIFKPHLKPLTNCHNTSIKDLKVNTKGLDPINLSIKVVVIERVILYLLNGITSYYTEATLCTILKGGTSYHSKRY